jgi:hypothetical protein
MIVAPEIQPGAGGLIVAPEQAFLTVLPGEPEGLGEKNAAEFKAICEEVERIAAVQEAREKYEAATDRVAKLKTANIQMNKRGKELFERIAVAKEKLESGLVEYYASGGNPVDAAELFNDVMVSEGERGAIMRGLTRLGTHLAPLAAVAQLRAEADLLTGRADQLKRVANERIAKTAELLRAAAEFESGLTIDTRKSLSGVILAYAESLASRSVEASAAAFEQERLYRRLNTVVQ